jgi:glucuronyl/N-acetylglucosaminyl transferase EXT2
MVSKIKTSAIKATLTEKVGISGSVFVAFIIFILFFFNSFNFLNQKEILNLQHHLHVRIEKEAELARVRNPNCSFFDCFNVYRCGHHLNRVMIYVYPFTEYSDDKNSKTFITKEFYKILKTIIASPYYTPNPHEACIFVPSIDLLNQNLIDKSLIGKALATLEHWENGRNHLLFTMIQNEPPDLQTADAIVR